MERLKEAMRMLEEERLEKEKLKEELEMVETRIPQHDTSQYPEDSENFFKRRVLQIEEILEEQLGNSEHAKTKKWIWEEEVGILLNDYSSELRQVQEKFVGKMVNIYQKNLPSIPFINDLLKIDPDIH